jgi:putative NADPH-quinone reductase
MRILVLYAHPNPESYVAALHREAVAALRSVGHEVDDCDLYAEGFDPVLSREERVGYHQTPANRATVEPHVERLMRAEALLIVHPVWNFGYPAILKGYFDRVFLPGVSFVIENGLVRPNLHHIRHLVTVATYGAPRWRAALVGDPPRRYAGRVLRLLVAPRARYHYLALHDMNRATQQQRDLFRSRVVERMKALR